MPASAAVSLRLNGSPMHTPSAGLFLHRVAVYALAMCLLAATVQVSPAEPGKAEDLGEAAHGIAGPRPKVGAHHGPRGFTNPGYASKPPTLGLGVGVEFLWRRVRAALDPPVDKAPPSVKVDRSFLMENAGHSLPTVTWIGHATLLVQMGHSTFLVDPIWSDRASPLPFGTKRFVAPPIALEELPSIDFVLVSHNHYDHMDTETLAWLARSGAQILVPLANEKILYDAGVSRSLDGRATVRELDWWDSEVLGGVEIHAVPARHWSRRSLFDRDRSLWSGWVVRSAERSFYYSGDTSMFDGFAEIERRLGPIDLAAVPIGAYDPPEIMARSHMNPEEAVAALQALNARNGLALHFGTFDLSDEPVDEPPQRFRAASQKAGRGEQRDWVLDIGETRRW